MGKAFASASTFTRGASLRVAALPRRSAWLAAFSL